MDPPANSAGQEVGPHLLGRVYRADARDWSLDRLMGIAEPSESILQQTVEQVMQNTTYFTDWRSYLVFWRWLRKHQVPVLVDTKPPWEIDIQLDQGQTNHCVGFGWAGWGDAAPTKGAYQNADGHAIYYECKVIDGEPHGENGSTVRSGAIAMRNRARLAAFAFAQTTAEINTWIDTQGTVVCGTTWTNDMFNPDGEGYVKPTGGTAGGHCYLMIDRLDDQDAYLFQNSWGNNWGASGQFKMKRTDFDSLLADNGEACLAAELPI
jgi:hypothetical protein